MDEQGQKPDELEQKLDRLISEAGKLHEESFKRPDEDAIDACLLSNATETQMRQVQAALRASSAFRREVRSQLRDLERLHDPQIREHVEGLVVPPAPDIESQLRERDVETEKHESYNKIAPDRRLSRFFELNRLIPSLAVAAILVVVAVKFLPQAPTGPEKEMAKPPVETASPGRIVPGVQLANLILIDSDVEPGSVAALNLRSTPSSPHNADSIFISEKEAACASFKRLVTLDVNHNYQLLPRKDGAAALDSISGGEKYTLEFELENVNARAQLSTRLPSAKNPGTDLSIWVLDLHNRTLSRATLRSQSSTVKLPITNMGTFAVVYTIGTPGGFRSGAIGCIQLGTESDK